MKNIKKHLAVFNLQTLSVALVAFVSSAGCLYFQLSIFIDFLILGLMMVFPLTFLLRAAFSRRVNALQYLSLFMASF